jgi:hypothetical protein
MFLMFRSNSAIWKTTIIAMTAALIIAFALPTRNASNRELPTLADRSLLEGSKAPQPILAIFERACQDCHSANTEWPWYSRIPPISRKIHEDVAQGRKTMDLSKWGTYTNGERSGFLLAIIAATQTHIMPPQKYVWMHPKAKLSEMELGAIKRWALTEYAAIPKKTVRQSQLSESTQISSQKR